MTTTEPGRVSVCCLSERESSRISGHVAYWRPTHIITDKDAVIIVIITNVSSIVNAGQSQTRDSSGTITDYVPHYTVSSAAN